MASNYLHMLDVRIRPCAYIKDVISGCWRNVVEGVNKENGKIVYGFKVVGESRLVLGRTTRIDTISCYYLMTRNCKRSRKKHTVTTYIDSMDHASSSSCISVMSPKSSYHGWGLSIHLSTPINTVGCSINKTLDGSAMISSKSLFCLNESHQQNSVARCVMDT